MAGDGTAIVTRTLPLDVAIPPAVVTLIGPLAAPTGARRQLAGGGDGEAARQCAMEADADSDFTARVAAAR